MISAEKVIATMNEKPAIPIGIGIIIGYILVWAVHLGDMVAAHGESIDKVKTRVVGFKTDLHVIDLRLQRIELALGIKQQLPVAPLPSEDK